MPKELDEEVDCWCVNYPTCPYCGYVIFEDYYDCLDLNETETEQIVYCPECDKMYNCSVEVKYYFTSYKKPIGEK